MGQHSFFTNIYLFYVKFIQKKIVDQTRGDSYVKSTNPLTIGSGPRPTQPKQILVTQPNSF